VHGPRHRRHADDREVAPGGLADGARSWGEGRHGQAPGLPDRHTDSHRDLGERLAPWPGNRPDSAATGWLRVECRQQLRAGAQSTTSSSRPRRPPRCLRRRVGSRWRT
jgi:hypothetical protein